MRHLNRRLAIILIALPALLSLATPTTAKTFNPIALINDGGYTINVGTSVSTFLYVDVSERGSEKRFWVRVERNQGSLPGNPQEPGVDPRPLPVLSYIKYFPLSRFYEVLKSMRQIETFGLVNPYSRGFTICDANNSFIRYYRRSISIAYNCGADAPDADTATLNSDKLLKALRNETIAEPDMTTVLP